MGALVLVLVAYKNSTFARTTYYISGKEKKFRLKRQEKYCATKSQAGKIGRAFSDCVFESANCTSNDTARRTVERRSVPTKEFLAHARTDYKQAPLCACACAERAAGVQMGLYNLYAISRANLVYT